MLHQRRSRGPVNTALGVITLLSSPESELPNLNSEILRAYAEAAVENGKALITEATLLREHGHRARAYFLAVAAIEEIGKSLLAFDAQGRNLLDPAVSMKLSRALSDHESKIRSAFIGFLAADPRTNVKPAIDLIIALQHGREPAMYTDLRPDLSIQVPSVVVREAAAMDCVRLATDCLRSAIKHMAETLPEKRTVAQDQLFAMKSSHAKSIMETEDFWRYYIAQTENGNKDFSEAVINYRANFVLKGKRFQEVS